jgi:hypothetical protein
MSWSLTWTEAAEVWRRVGSGSAALAEGDPSGPNAEGVHTDTYVYDSTSCANLEVYLVSLHWPSSWWRSL